MTPGFVDTTSSVFNSALHSVSLSSQEEETVQRRGQGEARVTCLAFIILALQPLPSRIFDVGI